VFDEAATDRESPGAGKLLRIVAGTRLRYLGRDFTANCSFSFAARLRRNSQVPAARRERSCCAECICS